MNATYCVQTGGGFSAHKGHRVGHGVAVHSGLKLSKKEKHKHVKFEGSAAEKEWGNAENLLKDFSAVEFTIKRNMQDVTVYAQLNFLVVRRNGTAEMANVAVGVEVEKPSNSKDIVTLADIGGAKISDPAQGEYTCVVEFGDTQYVMLLNQ